jgi:hypothetical protein
MYLQRKLLLQFNDGATCKTFCQESKWDHFTETALILIDVNTG